MIARLRLLLAQAWCAWFYEHESELDVEESRALALRCLRCGKRSPGWQW